MRSALFLPAALLALALPAPAQLTVQDLNTGLTPTDLVNTLTGGGLSISNVSYTGGPECSGTFSGGTALVGFESGIILTTGSANGAIGPNNSGSTTGFCSQSGDSDLDTLTPFGYQTNDASVLEFDFVCEGIDFITFSYVFSSEEYNEWVFSSFNDVFGFFVNGVNVALLPDGVTPVTIDTVNNFINPAYYFDNTGGARNIEYDGLTVVLTVNAPVNPGVVNHIKLAVGDTGDQAYDSAVFIEANSFTCGSGNTAPTCVADLDDTELEFYQPNPGEFVVTEGSTFFFDIVGMDAEGDPLSVGLSGLPGANLSVSTSGTNTIASVDWTPSAADKAGAPYTAKVTFTDPAGESTTCEVEVVDVNLKPDCSATSGAGGTLTYQCTSTAGAEVTLTAVATDGDDTTLGYHWDVSNMDVALSDDDAATTTGVFPMGTTMVTLTVTDGRGGIEMCDILVEVVDTTPPSLACSTDVAMLWPPNHKMHDVTLVVVADDACTAPGGGIVNVLVSSDEPDNVDGVGDGDTDGDVDGYDGYIDGMGPVDVSSSLVFDSNVGTNGAWVGTIQLRAERDGTQDGRKYTLHVEAVDASGNVATSSCCVVVPHDRRKN